MGNSTPEDSEHSDLGEIIGQLKERIDDTRSRKDREEGKTRYVIAGLLALAFFLLPIVLFKMTHDYNKDLIKSQGTSPQKTNQQPLVEPISPNEILTSTFSYASAPLAFMLGYYFNKSKNDD